MGMIQLDNLDSLERSKEIHKSDMVRMHVGQVMGKMTELEGSGTVESGSIWAEIWGVECGGQDTNRSIVDDEEQLGQAGKFTQETGVGM